MDQIISKPDGAISVLDGLAMQAQTFAGNITANLLQLGRVFAEAKPLVKHGEWEDWIARNSGMSLRTAQNCMAAYRRFGNRSGYESLEKSKLFAMLALPEGKEEDFSADNDVESMTAREVKEAVKAVREEMQAKIDAAEQRAKAAESQHQEVPQEILDEMETMREENGRLSMTANDLMNQRSALSQQLMRAKQDMFDTEKMLEESQQEYNRLQGELLNARSAIAKGDAERRVSEQMSGEDFANAVRAFMGAVSQMPFMGGTFAAMRPDERTVYDEYLRTVEDWARRARTALDTIHGEVYVV